MKLKRGYSAILLLSVILVIFISGCIQQADDLMAGNKTQQETSDEEKGLGTLCSGEVECRAFCYNNQRQCESYCRGSQNELCTKIFPAENPSDTKKDDSKPQIEHIGIQLDFYDPLTNKAGDIKFHTFMYPWNSEVYNSKIFYDYGEVSPGEDGTIELEPQPVYIAPLGTKVRAITSGVVLDIRKIYSGDYTIMVIKPEYPGWIYEHEHVINPTVNIGDTVTSGQVLAEVSNYNQWLRNDGYGVLDIGILSSVNGKPLHHCPYQYLDESVKQFYFERIRALYTSWEEYTGNSSLYNEEEHAIPGCITLDPIQR